jgi:hypothetical protein
MPRPQRGGAHGPASKRVISEHEQRRLEDALAGLPTAPSGDGAHHAEDLRGFDSHANPYLRAYTRVLLAGYALSRGQIVDAHSRFKTASRDAEAAGVDVMTIGALNEAAAALERAMAPDGSIATALVELRERTLQRLWARFCETSQLPPPSFARIFGRGAGKQDAAAAEAADRAAIRALMLVEDSAEDGDDDDDGGDEDDDGDDDDGDDDDGDDERDGDDGGRDGGDGDGGGDRRGGGGGDGGKGGGWSAVVQRKVEAEKVAESVLAAVVELLAAARKGAPSKGKLHLRLELTASAGGDKGEGGGGKRRRRRRKH